MMDYFDRVVLINLRRRPERLERVMREFTLGRWPFKQPAVVEAVDGSKLPLPLGWNGGAGSLGCMLSHRRVFEQTIMDDVKRLLVLEDDLILRPDFPTRAIEFVKNVPDDWDQLMFGGEIDVSSLRSVVSPGIIRVNRVSRTHCYAVRGEFMRALYLKWITSTGHCDHRMLEVQRNSQWKVYAPDPFLAGQFEGQSDINHADNPVQFWGPVPTDYSVVLLRCPKQVAGELTAMGWYRGHAFDPITGVEVGLQSLMAVDEGHNAKLGRLRDWMKKMVQAAADINKTFVVWHGDIRPEMIKQITGKNPLVVDATCVNDALGIWKGDGK